jgi:hypothetical protein
LTATYDPTTQVGQVRFLCFDTDLANPTFTDEEIEAILNLYQSSVRLAGARCLRTIAVSEMRTLKVVKMLGLTTNGAMLAKELEVQAQKLEDEYQAGWDDGLTPFDYAEMVFDEFSERERLAKELLRENPLL